jgi:SNF2 family DNA or RNA helicase
VRTVKLQPGVRAEVKVPWAGTETEYCFMEVYGASEDGAHVERWINEAWVPSVKSGALSKDKDLIRLERSAPRALIPPLEQAGFKWDYHSQRWQLRLTKKFPETFVTFLQALPPETRIELGGELASFQNAEVAGRIRLQASEAEMDWFDLRVIVDVDDATLTPEEIKLLLDAKGKWVRLENKGWKKLAFTLSEEEDQELARLGLTPHQLTSEPQRMHALQLADKAARRFLPEEACERIERRASELQARVTPEVPAGITAALRPYQRDGFHFLAYLSTNRFGGILADDMGLGKTLQTLAWIEWLRETRNTERGARNQERAGTPATEAGQEAPNPHPSLVVCPKSVADNWHAEAARFLPGLKVKAWPAGELQDLPQRLAEADLHVINYSQLRSVGDALVGARFLAVVLDEGQYIKNPASLTAQIARKLRAEHRLILSGTPIENRLLDLWSLMSFAMPGALGNRAEFGRLYDAKGDPFARQRLSARVRPFLIRRTKAQVARELPDRIEEDLFCELEGEQKTLYRAELKRAQAMLLGIKTAAALNQQRFHFLTSLLRLRQICCHPRLVKPDSKAASAKVEALLETLEPLMDEGQKVLVFSQFVELLDLLRGEVKRRKWKHWYLAGDTEHRGDLVREFQAAEGGGVFLISLKAGGFGLNLTASSYVILFDPWWNPAVENQAIDRTHRIGQTQKVIAYRLLIKDSIEEKIRALQRQKKGLAEDVLGEEKFAQSLSLEDLRYLLAD